MAIANVVDIVDTEDTEGTVQAIGASQRPPITRVTPWKRSFLLVVRALGCVPSP